MPDRPGPTAPNGAADGSGLALEASTVSARLWRDALPLAYLSLHHPFVAAGIGAGALPRSAWQSYVAQDAHYLRHFAASYAACMDKLEHLAQLAEGGGGGGGGDGDAAGAAARALRAARARVGRLLSSVTDELRLHGGYAERWGVPRATLERGPLPATDAYTSYLAAVAADPASTPADVLAAMAPCARLYAWLGRALKAGLEAARRSGALVDDGAQNPYAEWIETYSGDEYCGMVEDAERLLDELVAATGGGGGGGNGGGGNGGGGRADFGETYGIRCCCLGALSAPASTYVYAPPSADCARTEPARAHTTALPPPCAPTHTPDTPITPASASDPPPAPLDRARGPALPALPAHATGLARDGTGCARPLARVARGGAMPRQRRRCWCGGGGGHERRR
jgi:thiaminase/transcriptional activator TenA